MSLPTSFPSTYDFRLIDNIKPFYEAINRRLLALGGTSLGVPAIGDDCSGAGCTYIPPGAVARYIFNIDSFQGAVVGMAGAFVDSSLLSTLSTYTVTYTGGGAPILPLLNWSTSGGDADEATSGPNILKRIGCTVDRNGNYNLTRKRPARIMGLTQLDPTDGVTVIAGLYDDGLLNAANDTPAIGAVAYYDPPKVNLTISGVNYLVYPDGNAGCRYILTMVGGVKTWVKATDQKVKLTELTGWGVAAAGDYLGPWIYQQLAAMFPLMKDQKAVAGYSPVVTMSGASYVNDHDPHPPAGHEGAGTGDQDNIVPNAKAAAITDYSAGGAWLIGGGAVSFPAAQSQYSVEYVGSDSTYPGDGYSSGGAGLARVTAKFTVGGQNAVKTSNRTIEWFYWIDGKTVTFDGLPFGKLGDDIPDQSKLTSFETASPGMAAVSETTNIFPASTSYPAWPTTRTVYVDYTLDAGNISTPHYLAEYGNSWSIGGNFAIIRWSFTD